MTLSTGVFVCGGALVASTLPLRLSSATAKKKKFLFVSSSADTAAERWDILSVKPEAWPVAILSTFDFRLLRKKKKQKQKESSFRFVCSVHAKFVCSPHLQVNRPVPCGNLGLFNIIICCVFRFIAPHTRTTCVPASLSDLCPKTNRERLVSRPSSIAIVVVNGVSSGRRKFSPPLRRRRRPVGY